MGVNSPETRDKLNGLNDCYISESGSDLTDFETPKIIDVRNERRLSEDNRYKERTTTSGNRRRSSDRGNSGERKKSLDGRKRKNSQSSRKDSVTVKSSGYAQKTEKKSVKKSPWSSKPLYQKRKSIAKPVKNANSKFSMDSRYTGESDGDAPTPDARKDSVYRDENNNDITQKSILKNQSFDLIEDENPPCLSYTRVQEERVQTKSPKILKSDSRKTSTKSTTKTQKPASKKVKTSSPTKKSAVKTKTAYKTPKANKPTTSVSNSIHSKSSFGSVLTRYSMTDRSDPNLKQKAMVNSFRHEEKPIAAPSKNLKNPRTGRIIIRQTASSRRRLAQNKVERAKSETRARKTKEKAKGIHDQPFKL